MVTRGSAVGIGPAAVRARAAVRVELSSTGTPRVTELRSVPPVVLRCTSISPGRAGATSVTQRTSPLPGPAGSPPAGRPGGRDTVESLPTVTVHLVSAAAGPLAGDDLALDISVGVGVRLVVRSVAATVALPGHGPGPSRFTVTAQVADGGALDLEPEPTVVARGADHRMITDVSIGEAAYLRIREEILLGRFGEPAGSVHSVLRVDVVASHGPAPLLRQDLVLGPDAPGLSGPAVLGHARAVGSLLIAAPAPTSVAGDNHEGVARSSTGGLGMAASVSEGVALLPLAGPGYLISALADDAVTLRRRLETGPAASPQPGHEK